MNVVISGYYGYHNIGDEAILKSIINSLREQNPDINITVLSNDIEHTKQTYKVNAINRWNLPKIYSELIKSDGLISGGGSLLQDATSSRPIMYYTSIIGMAKAAKKPVFIYAQGLGPIDRDFNKKITKYFLNKSDVITLRDNESLELARSIGVSKNIEIVPDPVMGFCIEKLESSIYEIYKKRDFVTISVRDWSNAKTDFLGKVAKACDDIAKSGVDIVFVPMHGEHDEKTSNNVVDMMEEKAEVFPYNSSIEEKILCIKLSKLMIGMRLHALIFAATVDTPMIGISYDPKIDSFLNLVNQPCIGSVDDKWNSNELSNKAKYILENHKYVQEELRNNSRNLKNSAMKTAKKSIELFS